MHTTTYMYRANNKQKHINLVLLLSLLMHIRKDTKFCELLLLFFANDKQADRGTYGRTFCRVPALVVFKTLLQKPPHTHPHPHPSIKYNKNKRKHNTHAFEYTLESECMFTYFSARRVQNNKSFVCGVPFRWALLPNAFTQ